MCRATRRTPLFGAVLSVVLAGAVWGCDDESSDDSTEKTSTQSAGSTPSPPSGGADAESSREGVKPDELRQGTDQQRELLANAKSHFLEDRHEKAEPLFERVVANGPMSGAQASAYIALGQIYLRTDRPGKAVDLLSSMPPPGERVVEARLVLARAYSQQGNTRRAIRAYNRVIELQPNYLFAYPVLGSLYTKVGEKKKAAETYLEYENRLETMARDLEDPSASRPVQRMNILDVFSAVDDERAVEAVRNALDDPNPRVRARAARMTAELRAVGAEDQLERLAAEDPADQVRRAAASALERLNDIEKAPSRNSRVPSEVRDR